jgi:hypothetical protein
VGASERDEFLRAAWRALVVQGTDARRFVFVDEWLHQHLALADLRVGVQRAESVL